MHVAKLFFKSGSPSSLSFFRSGIQQTAFSKAYFRDLCIVLKAARVEQKGEREKRSDEEFW